MPAHPPSGVFVPSPNSPRLVGVPKTLSTIPLSPFLARKGEEFIAEGLPFGCAQGQALRLPAKGLCPSAHLIIQQPASRGTPPETILR